jgi:hypothetical protein
MYFKGHRFVEIEPRLQNQCDNCKKTLLDLMKPSLALECLSK